MRSWLETIFWFSATLDLIGLMIGFGPTSLWGFLFFISSANALLMLVEDVDNN